jgi:hypothetical protein
MISVHRIAGNTTDVAPVPALAAADSSSVAVQINDGDQSWLVVYPRDGASRSSRTVTTTYSGRGQAVVHGLAPGTYRVFVDGVTLLASGLKMGASGTLLFPANGAHQFFIQQEFPPVTGRNGFSGKNRIH